ncbi:hypothetical protein N7540_001066 [Penicillium herquei]|nr:hypothetical protein N7540_001066 [Penicillium herquei]
MSDALIPAAGITQPGSTTTTSRRLQPPPSRRREKPQLSCISCRRRKVRCDRLQPCSNCSIRGLGPSCVYTQTKATSSPSNLVSSGRRQVPES